MTAPDPQAALLDVVDLLIDPAISASRAPEG